MTSLNIDLSSGDICVVTNVVFCSMPYVSRGIPSGEDRRISRSRNSLTDACACCGATSPLCTATLSGSYRGDSIGHNIDTIPKPCKSQHTQSGYPQFLSRNISGKMNTAFRDVTPYSPTDRYQRFGGTSWYLPITIFIDTAIRAWKLATEVRDFSISRPWDLRLYVSGLTPCSLIRVYQSFERVTIFRLPYPEEFRF
jgi:hypothetical protein